MPHNPVLLETVIEELSPQPGETVVDATLGLGGHARSFCNSIGSTGRLIGLDQDESALQHAREQWVDDCKSRVTLIKTNFRDLDQALTAEAIQSVDIFFFDLGLRMDQIKESGRGFTFEKDEPLLMTYRQADDLSDTDVTAFEVVNKWTLEHLKDILTGYANEPKAHGIASAIVEARKQSTIETTGELVSIVKRVKGAKREGKSHPATQTFQAIRIAVNDEIRAVREGLEKSVSFLSDEGRIGVITFHSTEDRVVKEMFNQFEYLGLGQTHSPKAIKPEHNHARKFPASRSATLRIFHA